MLLEEPHEDEAMSDAESEEAEGSGAAEQEREQAAGSYVASLLQQSSLEDRPGRPSLLFRVVLDLSRFMPCQRHVQS